ncbi:MAG TPA: tetratricopeptide repeat protein [Ktedonobacterales bacterium]|jgi:tetratricopeptide (TPR) repeat protein|nr:tetratricopeptide repeat protein [Ktedonobacterales bacterium]
MSARPNLRTRMQTSLSRPGKTDASDTSYPRHGFSRVLRTLLLFSWSVILWFVGREGIVLLSIASEEPDRLTDPAFLLPRLLVPVPRSGAILPYVIYGAAALAFLVLLSACVWATVDVEQERRILHAREITETLSRSLPAAIQEQLAGQAEPQAEPQAAPVSRFGPPFDEALLPVPETFIGREADLDWLLGRLRDRSVGVTALGGMGGIGKSTLAAVALHQLRAEGRFADGVAIVLCQELTDAGDVLRRALARFDPARRQPETRDPAGLAEVGRLLLSGKDTLVVLDNVEPALDVRAVIQPLREAGAHLLLTARQTLPHAVVPIEASRMLDLLGEEDTLTLFARSMGLASANDLTTDQRAAAERIIAALGRHTLAVKLAGAYAADMKRDLDALADEMENPQRAIDLPSGETPHALALVFAESANALPEATLRLFAGLAVFGAPEFGRTAALTLGAGLGLPAPEASVYLLVLRALLRASTDDAMPDESDRERLRIHPLLRAFAASEMARWPEDERRNAYRAIAQYYAGYLRNVPSAALAVDEENVIAALEWAHSTGEPDLVAALCDGMGVFWRVRWHTAASLRYLPWGAEAAEAIAARTGQREDRVRAANLTLLYGQALRRVGRVDEAERTFQENLTLRRELGDQDGEAWALMQLGYISLRRGDLEAAEPRFTAALDLCRAVGDRMGEGEAQGYLGQIALRRNVLDTAEVYFQAALAIFGETGDRQNAGWALTRLGRVARFREDYTAAEQRYQEALNVQRAIGDHQGEGVTLTALGDLLETQDRADEAETYYRQGLAMLREAQDAFHTAGAARDLGAFLVERGKGREEGCALLGESARLFASMGLREDERATRELARSLGCEE